ncbi:hypothetical protein [Stutzerimonas stutzeri]|uniref:hypothetical protein n=1 Tax=Stutzerimonas stutzeri TaxID=316 RepID=UPI000F77EACF|nr:hypothetical protein [Stutzerimonas stutzeri]MDH0500537.1 hypothetical protein [Stutzerimonas stutzeri]WGG17701.1 hypothetical protein N5O82_04795 [Stutzerimonas stutzeri]
MKKIIVALTLSVCAFSMQAFATAISSGTPIQPGNAGCELLAEAVTINLSSNVYGAYNCDKANNTIRVGTCHKGGSRKQATIACAVVSTTKDEAGTITNVMNDPSCPKTEYEKATFESKSLGKGFLASTAGGSVAASSLAATCDSASPVDALLTGK